MTDHIQDNKRIAKNTLMLYVRMFLIMGVTFYTSRVVLQQLGVTDYGVYVVIGGAVSMLSFLNSSMTSSTQRYLNYELGSLSHTEDSTKLVFSTSLRIHLIIAFVVLAVGETLGLWFINTKLVIPESSMYDANVLYQTSLAIFCISIIQVPFNASIIAHEKMEIYAIISVAEAILKLCVALCLIYTMANKLAFYGIYLLGVQLIITSLYIFVCLRKFRACILSIRYEKNLLKEMAQFAGWNMFGSIAWLVRGQGLGILLNIFFGPVINAAKGISDQVYSAVASLNANFQVALNPQITKNYASHRMQEMELLAYRGVKFSTLLQWMMSLPIILASVPVLKIWLGEVPNYASLFVILVLFDGVAGNLFGSPIITSLAATGQIRNYQIIVSCILLLVLPVSYLGLKIGLKPQSVFYFNILFNIAGGIARLYFCKRMLCYSFRYYFKYVIIPVIAVMTFSSILPVAFDKYSEILNDYIFLILLFAISVLSCISAIWLIGLTKTERESLKNLIKQRI